MGHEAFRDEGSTWGTKRLRLVYLPRWRFLHLPRQPRLRPGVRSGLHRGQAVQGARIGEMKAETEGEQHVKHGYRIV
jgi:hypothetical protein